MNTKFKKVKWHFGKYLEIPDDWKLESFSSVIVKTQLGVDDVGIIGGKGIPLLKMGNLTFGNFNFEKLEYVKENQINDIDSFMLKKEDFLFNTRNSDILVGKCSVWKGMFEKTIFNNNLMRIWFSPKIYSSDFVSYFLNSYIGRSSLVRLVDRTTSVAAIYYKHLKNLKIILPKTKEQQKIASILSNVDNSIQKTTEQIEKTKQLKTGLMQKLLTKGIGHTKFKKVKFLFRKEIEIPEKWEVKKFDEIFEFLRTGTNSRSDLKNSGDIQYIHYGDIHTKWKSFLDCDSVKVPWIDKIKVENLPLLKEGDLIIVDASEDYEGSGASVLLKNVKKKKIVSGLHTIALRSKDESISSDFNAYLTVMEAIKKQIISYVTGISVYGLSKNNLKKVKIPFPPLSERQKISSILIHVDSQIESLESKKLQLQKTKRGLMQKLLTGQIRVKV